MVEKVATIQPLGIWEGSAGNQHPETSVEITGVQAAHGEWFFGYKPASDGELAYQIFFDGVKLENVNATEFGTINLKDLKKSYEPIHFHVPHQVCTTLGRHTIAIRTGYIDEDSEAFYSSAQWVGCITITDPVMEQ